MVKSCCVTGCTNRFKKTSKISFYRLPKDTERRSKWIAAIRRNNWNPGNETWICASHFLSGKKSDDPRHPDYVPSLFRFTSSTDHIQAMNNLEKFLQSREVAEKMFVNTSREQAATALLYLHPTPESEADVHADEVDEKKAAVKCEREACKDATVQTENTHKDIASLHAQIQSLNTECQSLRDKVHNLESKLKKSTLDPSQFDDNKIKIFTGLPNLQTFMLLFSSVSSLLPATPTNSLKSTQELLLTLMRLHLNLSEKFLAYLFGIHQSTVSRIFRRWVQVMANLEDNQFEAVRIQCLDYHPA